MMIRTLLACAAMCVVLVTVGCQRRQAVDVGLAGTTPLPIERHYSGSNPALTEPGVWLITSDEQLANLGADRLTNGDRIDFGAHSLLVVAMGQQPTGGYWARIASAQIQDGHLFFQGVLNRPGSDEMVTEAVTYPYAAAVLPKVQASRLHNEMEEAEGQSPL